MFGIHRVAFGAPHSPRYAHLWRRLWVPFSLWSLIFNPPYTRRAAVIGCPLENHPGHKNRDTPLDPHFSERLFGKPDDEPEFAARFVVLFDGAREETEHVAVERHAFAWNRDIRIEKLLDLRENEDDRADAVLINAIIY